MYSNFENADSSEAYRNVKPLEFNEDHPSRFMAPSTFTTWTGGIKWVLLTNRVQ